MFTIQNKSQFVVPMRTTGKFSPTNEIQYEKVGKLRMPLMKRKKKKVCNTLPCATQKYNETESRFYQIHMNIPSSIGDISSD